MRSDSFARMDAVHLASCACFQTSSSQATAYSRPLRRESIDAMESATPAAMEALACSSTRGTVSAAVGLGTAAAVGAGVGVVDVNAASPALAAAADRSMDARRVDALTAMLGTPLSTPSTAAPKRP